MKTAVMGFCWCDLAILMKIPNPFARPDMPLTFFEIYLGPGFGSIPSSGKSRTQACDGVSSTCISFDCVQTGRG
eukprot:2479251-Prymnesium_polylepis.1